MKSSDSVEPAPQRRSSRGPLAGETPLTARIRRKAAEAPALETVDDVDPVPVPEPAEPAPETIDIPFPVAAISPPPPAHRPAPVFGDRVTHARGQQARQLILF